MRCVDCKRKQILFTEDGRTVYACSQDGSGRTGSLVTQEDGCPWNDLDDTRTVLFHIAPETAVPGIRKHGLLPGIGDRSTHCGEDSPAVYFFPSAEDAEGAMLNWLPDEYPNGTRFYMVTAALPSRYAQSLRTTADYEVVTDLPVPPDYLDIQDLEEWYAWYRKGAATHA